MFFHVCMGTHTHAHTHTYTHTHAHTHTHVAVVNPCFFMSQPRVLRQKCILPMHWQEVLGLHVLQQLLQLLLVCMACVGVGTVLTRKVSPQLGSGLGFRV
jgi:hypothetical protein